MSHKPTRHSGYSSYARLTADTLITNKPCYFHGLLLGVSTSGGDVTIYNGRDATSGRKFGTFKALANVTTPLVFNEPIWFDQGLFVDVGSNVNEVTVLFDFGED